METRFFTLLSLSSAQKKNPTMGMMAKMKLTGRNIDAAEKSASAIPVVFPVPSALSISTTE